jgi:hypothetical protein
MFFPKRRVVMPLRIESVKFLRPYFLVLCGASLDFITTKIGLSMGFVEINPNYHLVWAYLVYTLVTIMLHFSLSGNIRKIGFTIFVLASFMAAVNNVLVIFNLLA